MMNNKLVTEKAAAEILGIAQSTLRVQRCRGAVPGGLPVVPFVRMGKNCVRYIESDLQKFINDHRVEGGAA
jgi:hypothetical protein